MNAIVLTLLTDPWFLLVGSMSVLLVWGVWPGNLIRDQVDEEE